jgi:uncharacterized protein YegP (UPF0339 family)
MATTKREIKRSSDIYLGDAAKKVPKRKCGFHILRTKSGKEFFFIYAAKNGKTIMTSETYKRKASCGSAIVNIALSIEKIVPLVYDESSLHK